MVARTRARSAVVLSRAYRQPHQWVFRDGCDHFRSRAALVHSKRRQTLADVPALVAVDWDTDRWCIAWLAAFSLFTTGQIRPSKLWSLKTLEPMTTNDFRELALNFPEAIESAHMSHPDFRVGGKIFATLGYPDKDWAMVKLTPAEQKDFVHSAPEVFRIVKGAWGRQGATNVRLARANIDQVREALALAWRNAAPKRR